MLTGLISSKNQERIKQFVNVFVERCTDVAVVVPEGMKAGERDAEGWIPWKPVDSPIDDEQILALEEGVGVSFPPLFRAYLMYKSLLMTDFAVIFPETPSNAPLEKLRQHLALWESEPFFKEHGLVPFAYDADDGGPVCFDIGRQKSDGDCPIVRVDRGRIQDATYDGETVAESFSQLLDDIESELLSYG